MAMWLSVTVSIGDDMIGVFSVIFLVSDDVKSYNINMVVWRYNGKNVRVISTDFSIRCSTPPLQPFRDPGQDFWSILSSLNVIQDKAFLVN